MYLPLFRYFGSVGTRFHMTRRRNFCHQESLMDPWEISWREGIKLEENAMNMINSLNFETATETLIESINVRNRNKEDPLETVRLYRPWIQLGGLYQSSAKYKEAISVYDHLLGALNQYMDNRTHSHSEEEKKEFLVIKGTTLNDLGLATDSIGDYMKAQSLFQQAISVSELANEISLKVNSQSNLGMLYENLGKYELALPYHLFSLKHTPAIEIWNHPHFATSLHPYNYIRLESIPQVNRTDIPDDIPLSSLPELHQAEAKKIAQQKDNLKN